MKPEQLNRLFLQAAYFKYLEASQQNDLSFEDWQIQHSAAILPELLPEK